MLPILLEDNHLLVVDKPAGLLSQADETGEVSLVDLVAADLKKRYHKPGNVYVGLVHRLDRPVSGVVLVARTSKAASRLAEQFRSGEVEKVYLAEVEGTIPQDEGEWADFLAKDARKNVVSVVGDAKEGKEASLRFRVLERHARSSTVELRPRTGRSHQIRVQLASRGWPILGDRKYGAKTSVLASDGRPRIALHAQRLSFTHPTLREAVSVSALVPADWPRPGFRHGPGPTGPGTPGAR
jgi:23S rRNA pseudouridine1911/1915/1917 synthase